MRSGGERTQKMPVEYSVVPSRRANGRPMLRGGPRTQEGRCVGPICRLQRQQRSKHRKRSTRSYGAGGGPAVRASPRGRADRRGGTASWYAPRTASLRSISNCGRRQAARGKQCTCEFPPQGAADWGKESPLPRGARKRTAWSSRTKHAERLPAPTTPFVAAARGRGASLNNAAKIYTYNIPYSRAVASLANATPRQVSCGAGDHEKSGIIISYPLQAAEL